MSKALKQSAKIAEGIFDGMTREQMVQEREKYKKEVVELNAQLCKLNLSKNRRRHSRRTIYEDDLKIHKVLSSRKIQVDAFLIELKSRLNNYANNSDIIKNLVKEILSPEDLAIFYSELNRRENGEPPLKTSLSYKNNHDTIDRISVLRKNLSEYHDQLCSARLAIDMFIEKNMPEINKGEWLKKVSEINTCLPPLSFLKKNRVKINF